MRVRAFFFGFFMHLKNGLNDASATEVLCRHVFFVLYRRRYEVNIKKYNHEHAHTETLMPGCPAPPPIKLYHKFIKNCSSTLALDYAELQV